VHHADERILLCELVADRSSVIFAAIVHNDDVRRGVAALLDGPDNGLDCAAYVCLFVERRNHD
jgi:hypothetical protein